MYIISTNTDDPLYRSLLNTKGARVLSKPASALAEKARDFVARKFATSRNPIMRKVAETFSDFIEAHCLERGSFKPVSRTIDSFACGETNVFIETNLTDQDVVIVSGSMESPNDELMTILMLADACERMRTKSITLVMPCFPYARQDRKLKHGEAISARVVASMLDASSIDRLITVHLHSEQIQGFFDMPVTNILTLDLFSDYYTNLIYEYPDTDFVVAAADSGGAKLAQKLADLLGLPIAIVHKNRVGKNEVEPVGMIGDVKGKGVILLDDMTDTAGTLVEAGNILIEAGAVIIFNGFTHPVLSDPATERLTNAPIDDLACTNTLTNDATRKLKPTVLDIAPLIIERL